MITITDCKGGGGSVLITVDYTGGRGVKKGLNFDYVVCERSLTALSLLGIAVN